MSRRLMLRESEVRIISVTPVAKGLVRPLLLAFVATALVVVGAGHVNLIRQHKWLLALVFVGPFALVALTRAWRWRSHKVHVTNERIVQEGGVLRHYRSSIELPDVIATRVDQRVSERLTRRGLLVLETAAGPIVVGKVRHPGALCRLIDAERSGHAIRPLPLDTVFGFEEPEALGFEVRPQRRRLGPRHE
jgi:membrane protein YdbS with pleckstrin-like domain